MCILKGNLNYFMLNNGKTIRDVFLKNSVSSDIRPLISHFVNQFQNSLKPSKMDY